MICIASRLRDDESRGATGVCQWKRSRTVSKALWSASTMVALVAGARLILLALCGGALVTLAVTPTGETAVQARARQVSSSGGEIAFGSRRGIILVWPDGTHRRRLTRGFDIHPAWS